VCLVINLQIIIFNFRRELVHLYSKFAIESSHKTECIFIDIKM